MKSTTTGKRRPQATNNHRVDCTLQRATRKTTKQQEELSGKPNRSPGNPQSAGEVHAAPSSKAYFPELQAMSRKSRQPQAMGKNSRASPKKDSGSPEKYLDCSRRLRASLACRQPRATSSNWAASSGSGQQVWTAGKLC